MYKNNLHVQWDSGPLFSINFPFKVIHPDQVKNLFIQKSIIVAIKKIIYT
jgi:hypothetical protein